MFQQIFALELQIPNANIESHYRCKHTAAEFGSFINLFIYPSRPETLDSKGLCRVRSIHHFADAKQIDLRPRVIC